MILIRKGNDVTFNGQKLTINAQATKGPGKEVVKIEGLEGSNGQKWYALSKLKEGENTIECQGREVTATSTRQPYTLTTDEAQKVKDAQKVIDDIITAAKARYVRKPDLDVNPATLTEAQRMAKIKEVCEFYGMPMPAEAVEFFAEQTKNGKKA